MPSNDAIVIATAIMLHSGIVIIASISIRLALADLWRPIDEIRSAISFEVFAPPAGGSLSPKSTDRTKSDLGLDGRFTENLHCSEDAHAVGAVSESRRSS